jgi:hypothetical protein
MTVSKKIIEANPHPHDGYGVTGMAGAKGLTAAEKILGSGVYPRPSGAADPRGQGNLRIGPPLPGSGADQQIGLLGQPSGVINSRLSNRFKLTNAYWPNSPSGVAVNP